MPKNKIIGDGMVDVSAKKESYRTAQASATITLSSKAFKILLMRGSPKGNVLEFAKVAGIMAVKQTPLIIPLCHPLEISKAHINFRVHQSKCSIEIISEVAYLGKTGVEMEALTAVSATALTIYDMMKFSGQDMVISDIKLIKKTGGKSSDYQRKD